MYFTVYTLALDVAKRAERAYGFEFADTSGAKIYLPWPLIKQMEAAYVHVARNMREYELAKIVSLAELDPAAIITLKMSGKCSIRMLIRIFTSPDIFL